MIFIYTNTLQPMLLLIWYHINNCLSNNQKRVHHMIKCSEVRSFHNKCICIPPRYVILRVSLLKRSREARPTLGFRWWSFSPWYKRTHVFLGYVKRWSKLNCEMYIDIAQILGIDYVNGRCGELNETRQKQTRNRETISKR